MPRSKRWYIVPVVCCAIFAPLFFAIYLSSSPFLFVYWRHPGYFDRVYYERIVAEIRKMKLSTNGAACFRMDKPLDATSLRPCRMNESVARGEGAGMIIASKTADGQLKVVFETRDLGHAGEYGFAYSDIPLEPQPFGSSDWSTIDVPSALNLVQPDMKIDDHWWQVVNNLD